MKLQLKFAIFNTFSKMLIIAALFIFLPTIINKVVYLHMDNRLIGKMEKALKIIKKGGIKEIKDDEDCYFGNYNLLKEEYILVEPTDKQMGNYSIDNGYRNLEGEVLPYRIISRTVVYDNQIYILEIGDGLTAIQILLRTLRDYTFKLMAIFLIFTLLVDLFFSGFLLAPLNRIINKKLKQTKHPSTFDFSVSKTTTKDFRYLEENINEMMHTIQNAFNIEKEFITNVSHELLTPITILQSKFENLLSDPNTSEEVSEKLLESQKTLSRLNKIIKTLLLISKIENEQYLKEDTIPLKGLMQEVIEEIEERLTEKNISLEMIWKEEHLVTNGNRSLLFTLFFNLINNAIKYNRPNGKIIINAYAEKDRFSVEISDTGIGIEKSNIEHIFERFRRFDKKGEEGYGLGLPIVKTISLFHDIDIKVTSEKDKGSTFKLIFKA